MSSIPGFDEDAYFGTDADKLSRPLIIEEAQAAAKYDEHCRVLASTQAPLDGCEGEPLVEDWDSNEAPADPTAFEMECELLGSVYFTEAW